MTAEHERSLVSRATDLADVSETLEDLYNLIGSARRARVDQDALRGAVAAIRHLGGNPTTMFRAVSGRRNVRAYPDDNALLAASQDIEDTLIDRNATRTILMGLADTALRRAHDDAEQALEELHDAEALPTYDPCEGCHADRAAAIDAARAKLADARRRARLADEAIEILRPLEFAAALAAIQQLPDDLQATYEEVYALVATDARAMPKDGDFITGEQATA